MAGWIRKPRSTGWWDITGLLSGITSGQLLVEREGGTVWLNLQDLVVADPGGFVEWDAVLASGLQPSTSRVDLPLQGRTTLDTAGPVRIASDGSIVVYKPAGMVRGLVSFRTEQPMISTVPGGVRL